MKGVVYSLGCKVNQYEGQSMVAKLTQSGFEATDTLSAADFYVINTCSVTSEADRKSRQAVARVLKLNPNATVYVCGCSAQNGADAFMTKPNVRFVSGTGGKMALIDSIMSDILSKTTQFSPINRVEPTPERYEDNLSPEHTRSRGFMKIQDGCNNFCSYCIVPYLRGRSRSRSLQSVLSEAQALSHTTHELVLSGINLSDYGRGTELSLTDLVRALAVVPIRKRLGSLECTVIDESLLAALRDSGFCDHFHLSLQSGSDTVLKRMNRHYDTAFYLQKVALIRTYFPNAGITTDVIAGFPEETEIEHLQTEAFIRQVQFSDMHVFPYSERSGTRAANMQQVDKSVRTERASKLSAIKNELKSAFLQSQYGRIKRVYTEEAEGEYNTGYTSNYIKVYSKMPLLSMESLQLGAPFGDGVLGEKNG